MISPRRSQARLAYSGAFATQADFGDPLSDGAIDTLFNLVAGTEVRIEFPNKSDEIIDCTGQELIDEILLGKQCRISFDIEADASDIGGLLGWFFGTVSGDDRLMLGPTEFQPPPTSFIYGHDDPAGTKLKLVDMVGEEVRISGAVTERIKVSLSFRGNGTPLTPGAYTFPECSTPTPLRLNDGAFTLDSEDRLADLRQIEFQYSNALLADDDPFTAASVDIQRMERADRRTNLFTFTIFGQPGDADHLKAIAYDKVPVSWRIGPADDGVEIIAASAILTQGTGATHSGQAARSVLALQAKPIKISGNAETPVMATVLT
jgi:hypothetical protein